MSGITIVHPMSLVGREVRDRLEAYPQLAEKVRLSSTDEEEIGTVTDTGGGATFVDRYDPDLLEGATLVLYCGAVESERQLISALPASTPAILLSSRATVEDGVPAAAGLNEAAWIGEKRLISPDPSALLLARLVAQLAALGLRRATATLHLPISPYGQAGLDALFEETRALITFTAAKKGKLFPAQVAFNLLPGNPDGAEIERQAAALLGPGAPELAAQSVQAGVFHGVTASLLVEGDAGLTADEARRRFVKGSGFAVARHPERLGPVESAGEERILIGDLRDAGAGRVWIWAAMDNLTTGGAINALRVAEELVGGASVS